MGERELRAILEKSRDYNSRDGITGLLIYKLSESGERANFMQLLEGEKEQLDEVFKRIVADKRHHTKIILERHQIKRRNFPDWSMGFQNVKSEDLAAFEGYTDLGSDVFWHMFDEGEVSDPLDLMKSFYNDN